MGAFLVGLHEHLLQGGTHHRLVGPADATHFPGLSLFWPSGNPSDRKVEGTRAHSICTNPIPQHPPATSFLLTTTTCKHEKGTWHLIYPIKSAIRCRFLPMLQLGFESGPLFYQVNY
ncbi:hypothetical protein HUO72_004372 [Salmonella enterica]|nr:hypothetical protein [Salmonella enterica]EFU1661836.1 hypothetical protein [Salmonella enterica]EGF3849326.1 hypothetical protein [Salmonella enterica]EHS2126395.1 hypothetical protein [Salmonella enterica]EHV3449940.1 hypothetical protein [Salmonella enterica]